MTTTAAGALPRAIAPNIHWLGACKPQLQEGHEVHQFLNCFLVRGSEHSVLIDTGSCRDWAAVFRQLDDVLGGTPLDYVAPTHLELAHAGNLERLLERYPAAKILGDVRDYHLHFPELAHRLQPIPRGQAFDLGGGIELVFLPAPFKDLPSTQWAYERSSRILFVADGFAYVHPAPGGEDDLAPFHRPADCGLFSHELPKMPVVKDAMRVTHSTLVWSRYVNPEPLFAELARMMRDYPPSMIAPCHGNVITQLDEVLEVIHESYRVSYALGDGLE